MPVRSSRFSVPAEATLVCAGVSLDRGAEPVLNGVSFAIGPGTCLGVVGPNGVGKSTLLRVLAGLEVPDSGKVETSPRGASCLYIEQERGPEVRRDGPPGSRAQEWGRCRRTAARDRSPSPGCGRPAGPRSCMPEALDRFSASGLHSDSASTRCSRSRAWRILRTVRPGSLRWGGGKARPRCSDASRSPPSCCSTSPRTTSISRASSGSKSS